MAQNKNSGKAGGRGQSGGPQKGSSHGDDSRRGGPRKKRPPQSLHTNARADLIVGRHGAEEALAAGVPLQSAFVQGPALGAPGSGAYAPGGSSPGDTDLEALARRLEEQGIAVERASRRRLDELSGRAAHQGVVLRARPYAYAEMDKIFSRAGAAPAPALVLILDHVTDQGNLGAIARSAEVAGAAGLIIPKARAAGVATGAYKASAGAVMHLPIVQVANLPRAIDELKARGFWVCGASEHATTDIWDAPVEGRLAVVVGSEQEGISRLVQEQCDFMCRLPQRGRIESLNVAQAATVFIYEWLRRLRDRG